MHVSLAEALEVRGGPLQEDEVWAVLSQSAESLHELLHRDSTELSFIISPWSLLLMPSGSISFTDENVTQQDLRAYMAPEVLEGLTMSSLSDIEKMHVYSLGMTLFWGADYEVPHSQPVKLGENLHTMLVSMCDDRTHARLSIRTALDACSTHIRNSSCEPPFAYVRKLVRLVLGSLSQLDVLLSNSERESIPERSKEIRERLRGKGLPAGRSAAPRVLERYRARAQEQPLLSRGLSRSMGSLAMQDNMRPLYQARRPLPPHQQQKSWVSSVDLARLDAEALRFGALEDARRGSTVLSQRSANRHKTSTRARDYRDLGMPDPRQPHHLSTQSMGPALSGAYDRIKEKERKLHALRQAMDGEDPLHSHRRYHSDYSSSSESPSVASSDPEYRQAKKLDNVRRFGSQAALSEPDATSLSGHSLHRQRLYDGVQEGRAGELLLRHQDEEVQRLQAHLAQRMSIASLYHGDEPLDLLMQSQRMTKNYFGPEFVKMASEPCVPLTVPSSIMNKKSKVEESRRRVGVVLLNGQRLELTCDTKAVCKDVLDMVVAHVGLAEHHLFGLASLKDNEFFFIDPDAKLVKVAPEGWKDEPKKKKPDVNFILFLRIKFFHDDVNLIQHTKTKHQYYLQLRKDILEERVRCDTENAMLLASLALQAEYGDYQPELHGKTYFRLEHYLPANVLDRMDQTSLKEQLLKLHSTYYGASESEAEFEFLKVTQRLTEYGVHFHRVLPEKRSQTGIMLGVFSKGVLIFEVLNGVRTPVLRFPWRETKKITFAKKKIGLQNTSDGIKHVFQTESNHTCKYLLQLCSDQHKFHLQTKARQSNQETLDIENSPLSGLHYVGGMGRAMSAANLAASPAPSPTSLPDSDPMKSISYSEASLNKPPSISLSHHNLSLESPGVRVAPGGSSGGSSAGSVTQTRTSNTHMLASHPLASSDTDSISAAPKQDSMFGSKVHSSQSWTPERFKKESDSSSVEESAYVLDSLKKKVNALPSPERSIGSIRLKKDVKYGLGFQIIGRENLGTFVSSVTPGGPADIEGSLKPGDRLISVNGMSLEGVPHATAVEILHSTQDDVMLVVSQPKERLYEGLGSYSSSGHVSPRSQAMEEDLDSLSEELNLGTTEHTDTPSPSPPPQPASAASQQQDGPISPQSSRANSSASAPPDLLPPALPPKTRKPRTPELPKEMEYSDRGDSDMDEDTCSSTQENQKSKRDLSPSGLMSELGGNSSGLHNLKPGDQFEVELSKMDSSLGLSVTGGVNTSVRHGGIYVKALIPKGAAEMDGRIQKGDRVMAVNGRSLEGATHKQAVEVLRDTGQMVHLLLEKGHFPLSAVHAPLTPKSTPPSATSKPARSEEPDEVSLVDRDYSFVTDDNVFEVGLLKNSSGLGFSFSREECLNSEPLGGSMVRVKKLFPGQPAAESGLIEVGDVILKVNQTSLKGLSQHEVISALRGTGQEVTLLLCRPEKGALPDLDRTLTPMGSAHKQPAQASLGSNTVNSAGLVEEALERLLRKSPSRRDSYSDSTDNEEVEKAFSTAAGERSVYFTPGEKPDFSEQDETNRSAYYSPSQSPYMYEFNQREPSPNPVPLPLPSSHSPGGNGVEMEDFVPEVELNVSLVKSEKGSLGFTLTKGTDQSCYIHDILQDPAKSDGRLQPGDRLLMVNNTDVSSLGHTEVVNLVRAADRVVHLVVGRVLEVPKFPLEAEHLPDITYHCPGKELGLLVDGGSDSPYGVLYVKDVIVGSAAWEEGSLQPLDLVHFINGKTSQYLTLGESQRLLESSQGELILKATRDGFPVTPKLKNITSINHNTTTKPTTLPNINGFPYGGKSRETEGISPICPSEEQILHLELEKPDSGGLGFSVIGGERGIFVKSITPGGVADAAGTLQVGDRLLQVNDEPMTGVSHTKAVTTIRKSKGLVHLLVSRPQDQTPSTYEDKCNGNTDAVDDSRPKSKIRLPVDRKPSRTPPPVPPIDYDSGVMKKQTKDDEQADFSEDTDCNGSSLPEDSPETLRKLAWREQSVDDPVSERHLATPAEPQDEDEITWGSDDLPIEKINAQLTNDGPIISEMGLACLPLVRVVPEGQYTGSKLNSVVRMLHGLLEQKIPLQEFENLQNLQPLDDCLIGQTKENKKKNRYKNIVPFDTTRVPLGKDGGYINANFIKMPVKEENFMYIACQGPLPTTLGDFWQMVWEQKSNVIAMMTQEVEGGKIKCQRYWPDAPRTPEMVDERLQITLIKDQHLDNFVIRLIEVKDMHSNDIQLVTHLNYTGWPDHGTPTQPEHLLTFISYMRHIHHSGPIITHCSAGIGRSGTLICIDVVLGLISKDADFDISDIVRTMRLHRQGMVQTEEQYIFCYQVVLYVLRCLQAEEKLSG